MPPAAIPMAALTGLAPEIGAALRRGALLQRMLAWRAVEVGLAEAGAGIVRLVLEHGAIQRDLARQARNDPLTGMLDRRAFREDMERRLDRLEREGLPGTLLFADIDRFRMLNLQ